MSKTTDGSALALVEVPFHGDVIDAVQDDRGVWVPLRRLCENLGISPDAQRVKLEAKAWSNTAMIAVLDSVGRKFEMCCLHLECLPIWLATIETSRTRKDLRPKLELYQKEAAKVLADHFLGRKEPPREIAGGDDGTMEDILLRQCQALVAHRRHLQAIDARVSRIEDRNERADQALAAVERSERPARDKTTRAKLNELVRVYVRVTGGDYQEVWNKLYKELYYRCSFDAKARAKNSGKSPLDLVDEAGNMTDLYSIASEILTF